MITGALARPRVSAGSTGGAAGPGMVSGCAAGFGLAAPEYVCNPGGAPPPAPVAVEPAPGPEAARTPAGPPEPASTAAASAASTASAASAPPTTRARALSLTTPGRPLTRLPDLAIPRRRGMPLPSRLPCPLLSVCPDEADALAGLPG